MEYDKTESLRNEMSIGKQWELCSSTNLDLVEILEMSTVCQGACNQTGDHAEAVSALLAKRASYFTSQ